MALRKKERHLLTDMEAGRPTQPLAPLEKCALATTRPRVLGHRFAVLPALLAIAGLLASGCGTLNPDYLLAGKRKEVIRESAEAYVLDLRWGRLTEARARVVPELRPAFMELFKDSKRPFHFTSVEVVSVDLAEAERSRAEVKVSYELFRPPAIQERRMHEIQKWTYDRETGAWMITPDLKAFSKIDSGVSSGGQ